MLTNSCRKKPLASKGNEFRVLLPNLTRNRVLRTQKKSPMKALKRNLSNANPKKTNLEAKAVCKSDVV